MAIKLLIAFAAIFVLLILFGFVVRVLAGGLRDIHNDEVAKLRLVDRRQRLDAIICEIAALGARSARQRPFIKNREPLPCKPFGLSRSDNWRAA